MDFFDITDANFASGAGATPLRMTQGSTKGAGNPATRPMQGSGSTRGAGSPQVRPAPQPPK